MPAFDAFVTENFDTLTFGLFFGCLFILGIAEPFLERQAGTSARKRRWPANIWFTALNLVILSVLPVTGLTAAYMAEASGFGLLQQVELPFWAVLTAGFLARSFVAYVIHVAMHKVPLLWRAHRIHHSDTKLDISTTARIHPLEFVFSVPVVFATTWLMGVPPIIIMLYELFDAVMAVLGHANVRMPQRLERTLQLLLVTPAMHRVHHSSYQPETDSNYGATLSIWDRICRTYRNPGEDRLEAMQIGLTECQDTRATSFFWLISLPFRRLTRLQNEPVRSKTDPVRRAA